MTTSFVDETIRRLAIQIVAVKPQQAMPYFDYAMLDLDQWSDGAAAAFKALSADAKALTGLWYLGPDGPGDYRANGGNLPFTLGRNKYTDGWQRTCIAACEAVQAKTWMWIRESDLSPSKVARTKSKLSERTLAVPKYSQLWLQLTAAITLLDMPRTDPGTARATLVDIVGSLQNADNPAFNSIETLAQKLIMYFTAELYLNNQKLGMARHAIAHALDEENHKPKSPLDLVGTGTNPDQLQRLKSLATEKICADIDAARQKHKDKSTERHTEALMAAAELLGCPIIEHNT